MNSYSQFIKLLGSENVKINIFSGAGISVASGIPDFRSPITGVYSKLEKLGVKSPEEIFHINSFRKNPWPFLKYSFENFGQTFNPNINHYFIAFLAHLNKLNFHFTQNVDGLDIQAGLQTSLSIDIHGNNRTAKCIDCQKEFSKKFYYESIKISKIPVCDCGGFVKPNVVFFGEAIPFSQTELKNKIERSNLAIVMGTSMSVFPFAGLIHYQKEDSLIVRINKHLKIQNFPHKQVLDLEGICEKYVLEIVKDSGWENEFNEFCKSNEKCLN